jgi:hypothetical protein
MARQSPRPKRESQWMVADRLPQPLVDEGLLPWIKQHMDQHPWCWACRAPSTQTVTALCRQLNPLGGNVTFYSLCDACATDLQVRQRIEADLEHDVIIAQRRFN